MTLVLDASRTLSFFFVDEFDAHAERILRLVADQGAVVPSLWEFEVANGLRTAERRQRMNEAAITSALAGLAGLPIERDRHPEDMGRLVALAREFSLSAYDAAYLEVALRRALPIATADKALRSAARAAGVTAA